MVLSADDVEAVARRTVELLRGERPTTFTLVDARQLADQHGRQAPPPARRSFPSPLLLLPIEIKTLARRSPREQTNLMNVLEATIPNTGGGPRARLITGTRAPRKRGVDGRRPNHPSISPTTNARPGHPDQYRRFGRRRGLTEFPFFPRGFGPLGRLNRPFSTGELGRPPGLRSVGTSSYTLAVR
jgi:hypothetical protein